MALISYFPWKDRIARSQLLVCLIVLLRQSSLCGDWKTPQVMIGGTAIPKDLQVRDIQDYRSVVVDLKVWQSGVLQNTLIFLVPVTLFNAKHDSQDMMINAITLKAEAFFIPLKDTTKFAPYVTSSFGPAVFQRTRLGFFKQGGNIGFQSTIGFGCYLTPKYSICGYLLHYCNAGINKPNKGLTLPVLSGGTSF